GLSNVVLSVTAKGQRLFLELGRGVTTEIIRQADGTFTTPGLTTRYRFETDAQSPNAQVKASALIIETESGTTVRAAGISADEAARMRAEREEAAKKDWSGRVAIELPENILERYAGHYANPFGEVMSLSRDGGRLFMEGPQQRRVALAAESEV